MPWMTRSLTELYFPCASRKRLDTPLTSTAISLIDLELLGEVALEPPEDGEGDQEEHDGESEDTEIEFDVAEIAPGGQHVVHLGEILPVRLLDQPQRRDVRVDAALEREDQRRDRIEEVDPEQVSGAQLFA